VGSGQACTVRQVLEMLLNESVSKIDIRIDPLRFRPVETPLVVCDASRLKTHTGWSPEIQLSQTLADVLNDWRTRQPDTV
jgi:GDP-4-dehydro-6-deoxy-D-mannose reductase